MAGSTSQPRTVVHGENGSILVGRLLTQGILLVAVALLLTLVVAGGAAAVDRHVATAGAGTANPADPACTAALSGCTVDDALDVAADGDVIIFDTGGTFTASARTLPGSLTFSVPNTVTAAVTLAGGPLTIPSGETATIDNRGTAPPAGTEPIFTVSASLDGPGSLAVPAGATSPATLTGSLSTYSGGTAIATETLTFAPSSGTLPSGPISLGPAATAAFTITTDATYSGVISETAAGGQVTKGGAGRLTLAGANSYTGATTVTGGTLELAIPTTDFPSATGGIAVTNPGVLEFNVANGDAAFAGVVSGTGGIAKSGANALTLAGVNTFTGAVTITGGTLKVGGASAVGTANAFVLSGGTLDLNGFATSIGSLSGTGGSIGLGAQTLTITQANAGTYQGTISGTGGITKIGTAALTLTGANTYSGGTTLGAGTLSVTSDANLGAVPGVATPGSIAFGGGALETTSTFTLSPTRGVALNAGGGTINVAASTTLTYAGVIAGANGLAKSGAGDLALVGPNTYSGTTTVSAGRLALAPPLGASLPPGNLVNNGEVAYSIAGGDQTYAGVISGTGNIAKAGANALTLSGTNTFTGVVAVSAGSLKLGAAGALTSANPVTLTGGTLDLNGVSATIGSLSGTGGTVALGAQTLTITQAAPGNFGGIVAGTGGLTKAGASELTLSGTNTYSGATAINAGTLVVGADANLGSAPLVATPGQLAFGGGTLRTTASFALHANRGIALGAGGGTLNVDPSTILEYGGVVAGATAFTKSGTGELVMNGVNTFTGAFAVNAGLVTVTVDGALGATAGGTTVASGATLDLDGISYATAEPLTISGGTLTSSGTATFAGPITLSAGSTVAGPGSLTLSGVVSGANSLTKSGPGTLTLSGTNTFTGATTILAGTLRVAADSNLGGAPGAATPGHLAVSGGVLETTASFTLSANRGLSFGPNGATLTIATGTTLTYNGIAAGSGALTKLGAGTLVLGGANTFTGLAAIDAGTLSVTANNALGTVAGATTVANGAVLDLNAVAYATAEPVALDGGKLRGTGTSSFAGPVTLASASLVGGTGSTTVAGVISGVGGLTKEDAGTLALTGTNTYTGATTISGGTVVVSADANLGAAPGTATPGQLAFGGGTLQVTTTMTLAENRGVALDTGGGTFLVDSGVTLIYNGAMAGAGAVTKSGTGTLQLGGASTFTGAFTLSAGTLRVAADSALGSIAGATTAAAGTTLELNGVAYAAAEPLALNGGTITVVGTASFAGPLTLGADSTITGTGALTLAGAIGEVGGARALTKTGTGQLILAAASTYTGATTITAGVVSVVADGGLGSAAGGTTVASGTTLDFNGVTYGTPEPVTVNGGTITGTGLASFSGPITLGAASTFAGTGILELSGVIGESGGARAVTKAGSGTITLSGTNTYTGATTISAGVLAVSADGNLGAAPGAATAGQLAFGGGTLQATGTFTLHANRGIAMNSGGGTISVDDATTLTYNGVIAGANSLTKTGTGVLVLGGANSYTSAVTVSAGTLRLGAASAIGSGNALAMTGGVFELNGFSATIGTLSGSAGTITLGAQTLTVTQTSAQTFAGTIAGTGGITKAGASTLTLTGANTYGGITSVTAGTLDLAVPATTLPAGNVAVSSGATIRFTLANGAATYAGVVSGAGGLAKAGTSTLTLTAANTYSGPTTVTGGTLVFQIPATTLPAGATSITSPGVVQYVIANGDVNYAGVISGTGSVQKQGASKLTLLGANTYSGATTVAAGTLDFQIPGTTVPSSTGGISVTSPAIVRFTTANPTTGSAAITGAGAVVKAGVGTLTLSGAHTYTGTTSILAGTLNFAPAGTTLPTTIIDNAGGLTFTIANGDTAFAGTISGAGAVTKAGASKLTFASANTYTGATTISAGTLSVSANDALGTGAAGTTVANGATLELSGVSYSTAEALTVNGGTVSGSGTSTFAGAVTMGADMTVGGTGTLTLSGVISETGGARALTKTGAGTIALGGVNTYTGATSVDAGTLRVLTNGALGTTAAGTAVASGATLEFEGVAYGTAEAVTLNGGTLAGAGTASFAGPITLAADSALGGAGDLTLSGVLAETGGARALTKSGAGSVTLGAANTYTGATTISAGTLVVSSDANLGTTPGAATPGHLAFGGGALRTTASFTLHPNRGIALNGGGGTLSPDAGTTLTYAGAIAGADTLTKAGLGTLSLAAAGSYTGATSIAAGVLSVTVDGALGTVAGGTTVATGATLDLAALNYATAEPLTLSGGTLSATGVSSFAGPITLAADSAVATADTLTLSGTIAETGGARALAKSGAGTVALTSANTYTGVTTVSAGTLRVAVDGALGTAAGATTVASGAILDLSGVTYATAEPLTLDGASLTATTASSFAGPITLAADSEIGGAGALALTGVIGETGGARALAKTGAGTLTLSGANGYTGATSVNAGALSISSDANLGAAPGSATPGHLALAGGILETTATFALDADRGLLLNAGGGTLSPATGTTLTYAGIIAGADALTKAGAGTLVLGGASTYTGATTVAAGVLSVTSDGALGTADAGTVVSAPATLDLNGVSYATAEPLTLNGGSLSATGTASFTGPVTLGVDSTVAGTGALTLSGAIAESGGARALTKAGTGTLVLGAANSYTGATSVDAGTLRVTANGALGGAAAGTTVAAGATLDLASVAYAVAEPLSLNGGLLSATGAASFAGPVTLTADSLVGGTGTLTLSAGIDETGGPRALTKTGAGTVVLAAAGTYTGATAVDAGTLAVTASGALGSASGGTSVAAGATLLVDGITYATAEPLTLAGGSLAAAGTATWTGPVALSAASSMGGAGTLAVSGVVSGAGTLTKTGAGTLMLAGANTFSGATTLDEGTLALAADTALGAPPGAATAGHIVFTGGTLAATATFTLDPNRGLALTETGLVDVADGATLTYAGVAAGAGGLVKSGLGTLVLAGANTYTGATTLASGALSVDADQNLGGAPATPTAGHLVFAGGTLRTTSSFALAANRGLALGSGATIDVAAGTLSYAGAIAGAGDLTKVGPGILSLAGASAYTGVTRVDAGTLSVAVDGALGAASGATTVAAGAALDVAGIAYATAEPLALDGGKLTATGTSSFAGPITLAGSGIFGGAGVLTIASAIGETGGPADLTKVDGGTLVLTAASAHTGDTLVNAGVLRVTTDGALGSVAAPTIVATGAVLELASLTYASEEPLRLGGGGLSGVGTASFAGPITLTADSGLATDGTLTLTGAIGETGGARGVTKSGAGTVILAAASSYTGPTTISAGTVRVTVDGALGTAAGATTVAAGAILDVDGIGYATPEPLSLLGTLRGTGTSSFAGPITLGSDVTIDAPGAFALGGAIGETGGARGLTKAGVGTLALSGDNTFTGATTLAGGTLALGADSALGTAPASATPGHLVFAGGTLRSTASFSLHANRGIRLDATGTFSPDAGTTLLYDGVIAGAGGLAQAGAGTLALEGASTFTGATTLAAGTLYVIDDSSLGAEPSAATAGHLVFAGGALNSTGMTLAANRGILAETAPAVFDVDSDSDLFYDGIIAGADGVVKRGAGRLSLGGASTHSGTTTVLAGILELRGPAIAGGSIVNDATVRFDLNGVATFTGAISGSGAVTTTGAGSLRLSGANTYTGPTTVVGGTLTIAPPGAAIPSGAIVNSAAVVFSIANGDVAYGGVLSGSGAWHKTGTSRLTLTGANTHTGPTTIAEGILRAGAANALGTGAISLANVAGARLDLAGFAASVAGLSGGGSSGGDVALGTGTLTVAQAVDATFAGAIGGTGGLVKNGAGTLTLSGANTYTGSTTNNDGTLRLEPPGSAITTSAISTFGSLVIVVPSGDTSLAGPITGTGGLTKLGAGELTLSGSNTYAGPTTIAAGTLELAPPGAALPAGAVANDGILALTLANGDVAHAGAISGTGGLVKRGADRLTLAGSLTYTGLTTVEAGTLAFGSTLLPLGNLVNDGTVVFAAGADSSSYDGALSGAGAVRKEGTGRLRLGGVPTYTGGTTVAAGTLELAGGLPPGGIVNAGTLVLAIGSPASYGGALSGAGAVSKAGAGALVLTGDSSGFTGAFTVGQGTLEVNGNLGGTLTVPAGSVLRGTGSVGALTVSGGTLRPGSAGTIGALGAASLTITSGTLALDGPASKVNVAGSTSLGGALALSFATTPPLGTTHVIVSKAAAGPVAGAFTGLAEGAVVNSDTFRYRVGYLGGDGNDPALAFLAFTAPAAPIPINATVEGQNVTLAWTPGDTGGSPITGYVVLRDGTETARLTALTYRDQSVAPGVHAYAVHAVNEIGMGPDAAATATVLPPPTRPGAPPTVSATLQEGKILVTWSPPEDGGAPIRRYEVLRNGVEVGNTTGTSFVDEGVPVGSHTYTIRAVNDLGTGSVSTGASATIAPPEEPGFFERLVPGFEMIGAGAALAAAAVVLSRRRKA